MSRFVLQLNFHWKDLSKLSSEWNIIKYFKPILNIKFKFSVVFLLKTQKKLCAEVIIKYFQFEIFPSRNLNYWVLTKLQLDIMTQAPMCVSRIWMLQWRRCCWVSEVQTIHWNILTRILSYITRMFKILMKFWKKKFVEHFIGNPVYVTSLYVRCQLNLYKWDVSVGILRCCKIWSKPWLSDSRRFSQQGKYSSQMKICQI